MWKTCINFTIFSYNTGLFGKAHAAALIGFNEICYTCHGRHLLLVIYFFMVICNIIEKDGRKKSAARKIVSCRKYVRCWLNLKKIVHREIIISVKVYPASFFLYTGNRTCISIIHCILYDCKLFKVIVRQSSHKRLIFPYLVLPLAYISVMLYWYRICRV